MIVRLTWSEVWQACMAGLMRRISDLRDGRKPNYGMSRDGDSAWRADMVGACGELAVAKATGRFWSGAIGDLGAADVGRLQVRATSRDSGRLIVHPKDDDEAAFILVTGTLPELNVRGWLRGSECKQEKWWQDPTKKGRPAFFVPQSALRPIEELGEEE